ncbi:DUF3388 domain-containing protein [Tepidibacillus infernus]|uniref:ACT domain-containing protein n=1 Tax=Tepidibacillus decaturensis TaxID=1413211 RepID=A0A135L392_9BACI|nr:MULTISPECIES: DUF3388 domain-containing protein [Tepidibacillus]KXG43452.1 hypothetical protein U473_05075 [Tepidibacillus decaturensis]GBF11316.1 ACT domain protein [Tepidibacillus sp. HK-1]
MNVEHQWYLEYQIHKNRPGLLGDISSILGMMSINIVTINGVDLQKRGMILQTNDEEKIKLLGDVLKYIENITITAYRPLTILDRLAVRHGRYICRDVTDNKTFRFTRDDLGLLVDFLSEIFKKQGHQVIGIRGIPRVGKTESVVAGSVSANKRWTFISSTLLRQTVRNQLADDEFNTDNVFIIDGIVSTLRSNERHHSLVREIMRMPATKVIEHPDIFIRETEFDNDDFDYIIELRNHNDEEISYDLINTGFSSFDIS